MATVQVPSDKRRLSVAVTADKTLAVTDAGVVQDIQADGKTITLPATAAGLSFTIRNAGVSVTSGPAGSGSNESVAVTISPNSSDAIQGLGSAASTNKDLVNTKATAQVGDEITLVAATGGWCAVSVIGTWAREA